MKRDKSNVCNKCGKSPLNNFYLYKFDPEESEDLQQTCTNCVGREMDFKGIFDKYKAEESMNCKE